MSRFVKKQGGKNNRDDRGNRQGFGKAGDDFMFNKTSLLSSALQKLKKGHSSSAPKRVNQEPKPLTEQAPSKKVKLTSQVVVPSLTYTPLQKDLYNFYTINKISLKNFESVPEPKLEAGSTVLAAICDRGIGGKYLVANLFRNKKAYIDYAEVPQQKTNQQSSIEALEVYQGPGDFIVGGVVKSRNPGKVQLSLAAVEDVNEKELRIGQVLISEIKSKQELGCHLKVKGLKKMKAYLPKPYLSEQTYEQLIQNKQLIVVIKQIDEKKQLIKVIPISEQEIPLNLKGIQEAELNKYELEHYVVPGTLINTKVVKKLSNGVLVRFLKIFFGFIHGDHLTRSLESYTVEEKIMARVIFACNNPPSLFLSQKHRSVQIYQPQRPLYSATDKPESLEEIQMSYFGKEDEFFSHPLHLHSQMQNLNKFWSKENNYFEHYQIMSSKKVGVQVGEVAKAIPFTNFKVYGQPKGKFRVLCLDVWNKVIKVSSEPALVTAKNLLFDQQTIDQQKKYFGFICNVNTNGVVIQFCNNIKGIISQHELQLNNIEINQKSIGQAFEVFVSNNKKNYLGLSITPPALRKNKKDHKVNQDDESAAMGVIQSIRHNSIHPIYVKLRSKLIKINIFDGIRPASLEDLPIIQDISSIFSVGDKVQVFSKKGKHYLYPPEQLSDKTLRFCKVVGVQGYTVRLQTKEDEFRNCHITDVTDIVSPHPLHQYQIGSFTVGRIVNEKMITLRKSLILNGFPDNMKQIISRYAQDEKRGDYRARIEAIGPAALKLQTVVFGYIKSYSDRGCFITLSRNFDVRVDKSQMSDHYIHKKEQIFTPNKLVLCRLINIKNVTQGQQTNVQMDVSLRESVVKFGYPLNDEILETGVGLTVKGIVTGYIKGRALVRLESSKLTGIMALKDFQGGDENDTLEKVFPIGKELTCKVTQYSREGQKRLIRLCNLKKVFKKYDGLETTFDCDVRVAELWENFQVLSSIEAPEIKQEQEAGDENKEEAEYLRLKKLLAANKIQIENDFQEELEQEQQILEEEDMDIQEPEDDEQIEDLDSEQNKREEEQEEKQQMKRRVAQFEPLPHPKEFYQSLLLANPTPESHLLYISSLLPTASPEAIRLQFQKAIRSLTDIKDKDNMWVSWLNTEIILGDLTGTVKKAVEANVGSVVYFRIIQILCEQENWPVAIEFGKKTLKKFNRQSKAYIAFLKMLSQYQRAGNELPDHLSMEEVIRRAKQCLKTNNVIPIEVHHARNLFNQRQPEQGRNIFEKLVTSNPRRSDLWSVYIDQEIKNQSIDKARNLMERALSVGLKKKATKSILKKYLHLQKTHGTAESVERILQKAKAVASSYAQIQEDDDEIQDIE